MTIKSFAPAVMPKEIRRLDKSLKAATMLGLRNGARAAVAILVTRTPKDTGQLKASWKTTGSRRGKNTHEVYNTAPHAGIVEEGARPHTVSREGRQALREWVDRHFPAADEKTREGIVEGICWKLLHYGQKPTYFVKNSLPLLRRVGVEEVIIAINAALRKKSA